MKTSVFLILLFFVMENLPDSIIAKNSALTKADVGYVRLAIDDRTFYYSTVDWRKSHLLIDKDVKLRLIHPELPDIYFKYSPAPQSSTFMNEVFPLIDNKGQKSWHLHFVVGDGLQDSGSKILFPEGNLWAQIDQNRLKVRFSGTGFSAGDNEGMHVIKGEVDILLDMF